jgi:hypothetical protein
MRNFSSKEGMNKISAKIIKIIALIYRRFSPGNPNNVAVSERKIKEISKIFSF